MSHYAHQLNDLWHQSLKIILREDFYQNYPLLKDRSPIEIAIISFLSSHPDAIFREISEELNISKSRLTFLVDRLENQHYLKRQAHPTDRRAYTLALTPEGKIIQDEHRKFEMDVCNQVINSMTTDEEKELLLQLLSKVVNNITEKQTTK